MQKFYSFFTKYQSLLYKILLFSVATFLIIYLLPKGGQFKYDFQKGKPWQYENLYAPFSFVIKKDEVRLEEERKAIQETSIPYFDYTANTHDESIGYFNELFESTYSDSLYQLPSEYAKIIGLHVIEKAYTYGVIDELHPFENDKRVYLKTEHELQELYYQQFFRKDEIEASLKEYEAEDVPDKVYEFLNLVLQRSLLPNVTYNAKLTQADIDNALLSINPNGGIIEKGGRIIAKGEVVEGDNYQILISLKDEYQSKVWTESNYLWLLIGYFLLVSLVFLMLFLFLKKYRSDIFYNNNKVTFIFLNIILMVVLTTITVRLNSNFVYIVPLCVLPLVLKSFFDARLGLFVHVLTLLLLGFVVPNSFEYLFLQIIAGIVTILTVSELYKRANLFVSVAQITLVYIIGYFAFVLIQEGNIEYIAWENFGYFALCGLATLFAHPLIYLYEKLFGLVSDVSLLELSDTNSKLLKELSNKAPGTFHHSLNVANLAEAAANEINANAMLVRVGALYHDIGKMVNPTNFTENQVDSINAHFELSPKESAALIIAHVIQGIEIARKNKLPERIIDFIRTHHGTNLVYYFYAKEKERHPNVDPNDFRYPGPIPFSKETAILMMADSVEAASKSLKEPTSSKINSFVESIISKQVENGQFLNANITLKEIELIKKVMKKKLTNIFHLRIEYPE